MKGTIDRIKRAYDMMKGNPKAMEDFMVRKLEEQFNNPSKVVKIPKGYKVAFHYDDDGHIKDITFERIH